MSELGNLIVRITANTTEIQRQLRSARWHIDAMRFRVWRRSREARNDS